jgi:hypothetical protein
MPPFLEVERPHYYLLNQAEFQIKLRRRLYKYLKRLPTKFHELSQGFGKMPSQHATTRKKWQGFCMPPFLEVERCHYHLNQAVLADETWAASLLVSNSMAYQVLGIYPKV